MILNQEDSQSVSLRERLNRRGITLPLMFITLNVLNILDKLLTMFALKNPVISELNPIAGYVIRRFGIINAMFIYLFIGFVLFSVVYKVVTIKRLYCEKNNMSPESFFLSLNFIFILIVVNNIFWLFYGKINGK